MRGKITNFFPRKERSERNEVIVVEEDGKKEEESKLLILTVEIALLIVLSSCFLLFPLFVLGFVLLAQKKNLLILK